MAILCITEIAHLAFDPQGNSVMAPAMPPLDEQGIPITAVTTPSAPFTNATRYVMVECDTACCLGWGKTPLALLGRHRMAANETRFYGVNPGDSVAVIASP